MHLQLINPKKFNFQIQSFFLKMRQIKTCNHLHMMTKIYNHSNYYFIVLKI